MRLVLANVALAFGGRRAAVAKILCGMRAIGYLRLGERAGSGGNGAGPGATLAAVRARGGLKSLDWRLTVLAR